MKPKRILLPNGNFAPFPEKLENKAIAEGKAPEKVPDNKTPEPSTQPEKSASVKKTHNRKAKKNNAALAKKQQAKKELDLEK